MVMVLSSFLLKFHLQMLIGHLIATAVLMLRMPFKIGPIKFITVKQNAWDYLVNI